MSKNKKYSVYDKQSNILNFVKNIYKKYEKEYEIESIHPKLYLNCWDEGLGKNYIRFYQKNYMSYLGIISKRVFNYIYERIIIFHPVNERLFLNNNIKFENICISWSLKNDFTKDGEFYDRYTNTYSRESKNIAWILIHLEKDIPTKLDSNILLIRKDLSISCLFNNLFKDKFKYLKKIKGKIFFNRKVYGYKKYIILIYYINKLIKNNNICRVFQPYEAQPCQQGINHFIHTNYPNIITLGYIHSALPPLPLEYIYRKGSPKKIITHGITQKEILANLLGWDSQNIINTDSLRFSKNKIKLPHKTIYLPYYIENENLIVKELLRLFKNNYKRLSFSQLIIRNHPIMNNSLKHKRLMYKINKVISKFSKSSRQTLKFSNKKFAIVIGASAVVVELIELGYEVFHITCSPEFDVYSPNIWKGINVKRISKYIYQYSIINKSTLIKISNKKIKINQLFSKI